MKVEDISKAKLTTASGQSAIKFDLDANIGDSPSEGADTSRYTIKVADAFQTYLMFKPSGAASRYVPLRKINWNWGGEASAANPNLWTVVANPVAVVDPTGAETIQHPQWNANADLDVEQNGN